MSGQIVQRNLKRRLTQQNIPPSSIADYVTIEDIGNKILETARDDPVVELDDDFRHRLEAAILSEAEEGEHGEDLQSFATRIAWHDDETLEELDAELSDYLRATDSGRDHDELISAARESDNQFVQQEIPTRLEVFKRFAEILAGRLDEDEIDLYLTRSHLVTAANEEADEHWLDAYGDREWLAVSTLNVLDNTTLQLILQIARQDAAPEIHFFFQDGTYQRQLNRLKALLGEENVETPDADRQPREFMDGPAAETLSAALRGEEFQTPETLDFVEAPERRREVEQVVKSIRERLAHGVDPSEIIVLARDVATYKSIIEDIFETNQIPYHIETPRPYAHVPAYRFLKATVDLLSSASRDEELEYHQLTDPLRLGFCYPYRRSSAWPVDDQIFLYLEQRLHNYQQRNSEEDLHFDDWVSVVDGRGGWDFAWELMSEYLEWIGERIEDPPESGREVRGLMRDLLREYIHQRIPDQRGIPGGPGIDPTRTNLNHPHPSSTGQRILNQADSVGRHYDFATRILNNPATWDEVSRAIGEVIGSGTYGVSNNDNRAIRVVDAANAHFLEAAETYFLGLASGEFPVDAEAPSFIHREFRNEVTRESAAGNRPALHFPSRLSQYQVDFDIYEVALRASTGKITALHRYKDSERNRVNWSPFVDLLPTDELGERIRADEWLPEPEGHTNWDDVARRISSKDRIRLSYYHSHRQHPSRRPSISATNVSNIVKSGDADTIDDDIMPRYDRYARPPTTLEVSATEPAFEADNLNLSDVIGSPVRTHELDLLSHCSLKYHFHQLVFNFEGEDVLRDEIPFYRKDEPDYRLGEFPRILRHNYVENSYPDRWRQIIEDLLPNRQADLDVFETVEELEEWFDGEESFSRWDKNVIWPDLRDEWDLVQQELEAGVTRDWYWQEERDLDVAEDVDVQLRQPGHRRDVFPDDEGYELPIFFVRHPSYAEKAVKQCWQFEGEDQIQASHDICRTCGDYQDCDYPVKYVLDHRFHSVAIEDSDVVGIQYQERGDDGTRRGYLKDSHHDAVRGDLADDPEEDFGDDTFPSWTWHQYWVDQMTGEASAGLSILDLDGDEFTARFAVDDEFVDAGGCESCVYRDMCMIPQSRGEAW